MNVGEAFPIISTPDLERMLVFYRDLLGGTVEYGFPTDQPVFVSLRLGASSVGIAHDPDTTVGIGGQRFALWAYVDDCDAAVAAMSANGVEIVEAPQDQPWGERMARVRDPDGNEVIVGQRGR
jgi:lactoylglutathione lyase